MRLPLESLWHWPLDVTRSATNRGPLRELSFSSLFLQDVKCQSFSLQTSLPLLSGPEVSPQQDLSQHPGAPPERRSGTPGAPRVTSHPRPRLRVTSGTLPSWSLVGSRPGSPGDDDGGGCGRSQLHGFGAAAASGAAVPGVPSPHPGAGRARRGGWAFLGEGFGLELVPSNPQWQADTPAAVAPPARFVSLSTPHGTTRSPHAPIRERDVLRISGIPGN